MCYGLVGGLVFILLFSKEPLLEASQSELFVEVGRHCLPASSERRTASSSLTDVFRPASNKKARSNEPRAKSESRHCPSLLPTRLAAGLELEVFYTKCLVNERFAIRPMFRWKAKPWFPRVSKPFQAYQLRLTSIFQTKGILLLQLV